MGKAGVFLEFIGFLRQNKKWWIVPMVAMILLLGVLVICLQSSAVTPFIYTLF